MQGKLVSFFSAFFIIQFSPILFAQVELQHIKVMQIKDSVKLELTLSAPAKHKVFILTKPNRLVVDLQNTKLTFALPKKNLTNPLINKLRVGQPNPQLLRLVFMLQKKIHFNILKNSKKIFIMVMPGIGTIDLQKNILDPRAGGDPFKIDSRLRGNDKSYHYNKLINAKKIPKKFIVVIDAGHGGKDVGAIGKHGTFEKYVVLAISYKLANLVNKHPQMRAILTRNGDYFVPLRNRIKLAHKDKADIFIAIHADSYFNKEARGASIYAVSKHGATSEAARWLAKQENYSELGGVNLNHLVDKSYMVRSVLIDLAQTTTIMDSLRLGGSMLNALRGITKLHHTSVEQAPFVVLKSPDIPSILIEVGFISNPKEEHTLKLSHYQHHLAKALFNGIKHYFNTAYDK